MLQTKLYMPSLGPNLVRRQRLIDQLNADMPRKLSLISAPAGYGKTSLVAAWIQNQSALWFSLDQDDNDPIQFLRYVTAALQQHNATLASNAAALLQAQIDSTPDQVLKVLINELSAWSETLFLVLDDYHLIENQAIHKMLAFLLEHLPPSLHLIITSRMELPFSMARWRVQQQVVEIRAADLCFTQAEMSTLFNDLLKLDLTKADIVMLEARTEGWIASLQLAALSMRQHSAGNRSQFIQQFAGSHRYLLDYLVDEILQQQSATRKQFLLFTSVLPRFNAELCAAILEEDQPSARDMLAEIEQANLLLIPLDDQGHWFRYHHLFADFLQNRLRQESSEQIPQLHRRASHWFADNNDLDEAVYHALQVPDYDRAATLLAEHIEVMVTHGNIRQAHHHIHQLPLEQRTQDPRLCLYYVWILMFRGLYSESGQALNQLKQLPNTFDWPIQAYDLVLSGYLALRNDQLAEGVSLTEQGLHQLAQHPSPDTTSLIMQGAAAVELAYTYTGQNRLAEASHLAQEAAHLNLDVGNMLAGLAAVSLSAELMMAQGRWHQAEDILTNGLARADSWANRLGYQTRLLAAAPLVANLGRIYCQWHRLDKAEPLIEEAYELYTIQGSTNEAEGLATLAELRWAQNDTAAIPDILRLLQPMTAQARPEYVTRRIEAAIAEWQTRLIQLDDRWAYLRSNVEAWVEKRAFHINDALNYRYRFDYVVLVRAWCLLGQTENALALLDRLQDFATETGRTGDRWRHQLLTIIVLNGRGDTTAALTQLQLLLTQTASEGLIQLYVDEGPTVAQLLVQCPVTPYRDRILATFKARTTTQSSLPEQPLIEPLSNRELEVLAYLADGATNQQIADALIISPATVKKHVSNIIGKLGVRNRSAAVARARKLGLIS